MRQNFEIVLTSFKMAVQELWKNKLRAFLSLFGVTIGIFCIIGVLATVNSLEHNIQSEIKSLGNNTIYIDKWDYAAGGGPDYPWWKYVNRPVPKYSDVKLIKERTQSAQYAAFNMRIQDQVESGSSVLSGVVIYGVSEEFPLLQPFEVLWGRKLTESEFEQGSSSVIAGFEVAEKLFGEAERAVGKGITIKGRRHIIAGVIKKQGTSLIGGWQFDNSVILSYKYARSLMNEENANPLVLVKGRDDISSKVLKDDLTGTMRSIRKLSPVQDDNFALNDISEFGEAMNQIFVSVNIGGWAIALLSLIVGMFGVANIMFVTVKERTAQIGLKKAIGAKRRTIMTEFLMESAFLCILGGLIGLLLVFILTKIVSSLLDFPIFISSGIMFLAIGICILVGVLAGIIPASQAARMDPVVAIRS